MLTPASKLFSLDMTIWSCQASNEGSTGKHGIQRLVNAPYMT